MIKNLLYSEQSLASIVNSADGLKCVKSEGAGTVTASIETSGGATPDGGENWLKALGSVANVGVRTSLYTRIAVTAGVPYTFSVYVSTSYTTNQNFDIAINYYNSGDTLFDWDSVTKVANGSSWVRYDYTFTPPAGTTTIDIVIGNLIISGAWYGFDCLQLETNDVPTTWIEGEEVTADPAMTPQFRVENACAPLAFPLPRGDMNYPGKVLHLGMQELDPVANKNLLTKNLSDVETNTTGFSAASSATVTRDTTTFYAGLGAIKVVTPGAVIREGVILATTGFTWSNSTKYVFSCYVKLSNAGDKIKLQYCKTGGAIVKESAEHTGTTEWTRISLAITTEDTVMTLRVVTSGAVAAQAITFYCDNFQLEAGETLTSWVLGNGDIQAWGKPKLIDLSNNPNNGTITGAVLEYAPIGYCRKFDGVDDYINCGNPDKLKGWTTFSVEAWAYISADKSAVRAIATKNSTSGATGKGWMLFKLDTSGIIQFKMYDSAENQRVVNWATPSVGWHHIVVTFDGSTVKIYGDTVVKDTGVSVLGHAVADSNNFIIGRYAPSGTWFYDDKIGLVVAYNRALSVIEVLQRYNSNAWRFGLPQK